MDFGQVQAIFERMGYDRVARGARAFTMSRAGWHNCFVAMACGEAGELRKQVGRYPSSGHGLHAAKVLGLHNTEVLRLVQAFDAQNRLFRSFTEQWLKSMDPIPLMAHLALGSVPPKDLAVTVKPTREREKLDQVDEFLQAVKTGTPVAEPALAEKPVLV